MTTVVSFALDIRPIFTAIDIAHMKWFCDLSSYDDVKNNSQDILDRLQGQGGALMPPVPEKGGDGPWSPQRIAAFKAWIDQGFPK